jgi:glycosyltransferase involved in cell wall biosynthesis
MTPTTTLCIVLPALNEAATIHQVIGRIPREYPGVAAVKIIVVDDGSKDDTAALAEAAGAVVVRHATNRGVGKAFQTGVLTALEHGADIMVNIDADGQFDPNNIHDLLAPILAGKADFVTASRFLDPALVPQMPPVKLFGNRAMSWLISRLTNQQFADVSCGFRAYTRDALLNLNLFGDFTYTQESFLDLSFKGLRIVEIAIPVRGVREFGKSRVASNIPSYALRSFKIIFRAFRDYRPMRVFGWFAFLLELLAFALGIFLAVHYIRSGEFSPHKWAGFASGFFAAVGLIVFVVGLLGDMLARIRMNQERILYLLKRNQK